MRNKRQDWNFSYQTQKEKEKISFRYQQKHRTFQKKYKGGRDTELFFVTFCMLSLKSE